MDNATNWDERGIAWERIPVEKQHGPHASDRVEIGHVQSPAVVDLDKAIAHFGKTRIESWLRASSSFDVRARAWFKARYGKSRDDVKMTDEEMRNAVYHAVLLSSGSRGTRIERETKLTIMSYTRIIRSGETVTYADLFGEAVAANIDAMPDAPAALIRQMVAKSLETAGFAPDTDDDTE